MDVITDWELVTSGVFQLHQGHQIVVPVPGRRFVFRHGTQAKNDPRDPDTGFVEYVIIPGSVSSLEFDVGGTRHFIVAQPFEAIGTTPWIAYFVHKQRS